MERTKLKKIRIIEEPKSEELLRRELEEALGGGNCGSYSNGTCVNYDNGPCKGESNTSMYTGV